MTRYNHQYLIAVSLETDEADPDRVPLDELVGALLDRLKEILQHDGHEAFSHNDTYEVRGA